MNFEFYKFQGTGNDFILLDNRDGNYNDITEEQVSKLCERRFGIGADGLMLLQSKEGYDFEMIYFNANGKPGSMCGNGGRCIVKFASKIGIKKEQYLFLAIDGDHQARVHLNKEVSLKMNDVSKVHFDKDYYVLNTGSPHYIKYVKNLQMLNVAEEGKKIRNSKEFVEEGVNVNFVEEIDKDTIYVRTYERGVEDETFSCGTGVTAAALIAAHNDNGFNRVEIKTNGGPLNVEFQKISETEFQNIWLSGPAVFVFKGEIKIKEKNV